MCLFHSYQSQYVVQEISSNVLAFSHFMKAAQSEGVLTFHHDHVCQSHAPEETEKIRSELTFKKNIQISSIYMSTAWFISAFKKITAMIKNFSQTVSFFLCFSRCKVDL